MTTVDFENLVSNTSSPPSKLSITGRILVGVTGGIALGLTVISFPFLAPALRKYCLPYIPATQAQISNIRKALQGRTGNLIDLGSGDGRIVFEGARLGLKSEGIELNPILVIYAKLFAIKQGLWRQTRFFKKDLWKFHLGDYNNITIFGVEQMMEALEQKFEAECKKNSHVIACRFPLPSKRPIRIIGSGIDTVWVYSFD